MIEKYQQEFEKAKEIAKKDPIHGAGPLAVASNNLAVALLKEGRITEARKYNEGALILLQGLEKAEVDGIDALRESIRITKRRLDQIN